MTVRLVVRRCGCGACLSWCKVDLWVCVGSYVLRMVGFVDFSNAVFPIVGVDV